METCCHNAEIYVCLFVEKKGKKKEKQLNNGGRRELRVYFGTDYKCNKIARDSDPNVAISLIILIS